jgi:hypothetical protein
MKSKVMKRADFWKNKFYSSGSSRENVKLVVKLGTSYSSVRSCSNHNGENNGNATGEN